MWSTHAWLVRFDEDAFLAADDGPDKVPVSDMQLYPNNPVFKAAEFRLDSGEEGRAHRAASRPRAIASDFR
ncbi:MAG TPA: hypothetical protein VMV83_16330 [Rectinemataceae bacterium]|nr:hypothetical protein [Rectinemataceae bacterium]